MISQALKVKRVVQCRRLGLYEHEAMDLLEKNGINVPRRGLVRDSADFAKAFRYVDIFDTLVKLQSIQTTRS